MFNINNQLSSATKKEDNEEEEGYFNRSSVSNLPTEPGNHLPSRSFTRASRYTMAPPESFIHLQASEHSLHLLEVHEEREALVSPTFNNQVQSPRTMGVQMVKLMPKTHMDFATEAVFCSEPGTIDSHHPIDLLRDGHGLDAVLLPQDILHLSKLQSKTPPSIQYLMEHFKDRNDMVVSPITLGTTVQHSPKDTDDNTKIINDRTPQTLGSSIRLSHGPNRSQKKAD